MVTLLLLNSWFALGVIPGSPIFGDAFTNWSIPMIPNHPNYQPTPPGIEPLVGHQVPPMIKGSASLIL